MHATLSLSEPHQRTYQMMFENPMSPHSTWSALRGRILPAAFARRTPAPMTWPHSNFGVRPAATLECSMQAPKSAQSQWTETELDESILTLCDEFPDARLVAFARAVEHCRRTIPRGTPDSLVAAMRDTLRGDAESQGPPGTRLRWVSLPPTGERAVTPRRGRFVRRRAAGAPFVIRGSPRGAVAQDDGRDGDCAA